jgi:hypothetical protein
MQTYIQTCVQDAYIQRHEYMRNPADVCLLSFRHVCVFVCWVFVCWVFVCWVFVCWVFICWVYLLSIHFCLCRQFVFMSLSFPRECMYVYICVCVPVRGPSTPSVTSPVAGAVPPIPVSSPAAQSPFTRGVRSVIFCCVDLSCVLCFALVFCWCIVLCLVTYVTFALCSICGVLHQYRHQCDNMHRQPCRVVTVSRSSRYVCICIFCVCPHLSTYMCCLYVGCVVQAEHGATGGEHAALQR